MEKDLIKVLVLGSAGMLGHVVYYYLNSLHKYALFGTCFSLEFHEGCKTLDITNRQDVESYIIGLNPQIIINCVGVLIKGSISDTANAIYINSYFPHQLSKLSRNIGSRLIHVSTDCVFSGEKGAYCEDDLKDARDVYGLSKALGEVVQGHDLTIRTSIIGPDLKSNGEGLFHWFMMQTGSIQGYTNAFWSGVTTLELARAIDVAIDQKLTGLYHITTGQRITKYDLLQLIKQIWNRTDINIYPFEGKVADKSLVNTRSDFDFIVRDYRSMLIVQFEFMQAHRFWYPHYFY